MSSLLASQGLVAYTRRLGPEVLIVMLNSNRHPITLDLPVGKDLKEGTILRDAWADTRLRVTQNQVSAVSVPARSGLVLKADTEPW